MLLHYLEILPSVNRTAVIVDPNERLLTAEWIEKSPRRVGRMNELVQTINTTDDLEEFKAAVNGMLVLCGKKNVVFDAGATKPARPFQIPNSPRP